MSDQADNNDKISSVLLAASALTALYSGSGDEEESPPRSGSSLEQQHQQHQPSTIEQPRPVSDESSGCDAYTPDPQEDAAHHATTATTASNMTPHAKPEKLSVPAPKERHLPVHKKPNAALTFPEKLMQMMDYVEKEGKDDPNYCASWLSDGLSFVVRHPDTFTRSVVPLFFKPTKFSSFTRKLYRWGFRQVNRGTGAMDPMIFGNECFQRDARHLMAEMRSITAANASSSVGGVPNKTTATPSPQESLLAGTGRSCASAVTNVVPAGLADLPPQYILPRGVAAAAAGEQRQHQLMSSHMSAAIRQTLAGNKRKAASSMTASSPASGEWGMMGPESKVRMLQHALDTSSAPFRLDDFQHSAVRQQQQQQQQQAQSAVAHLLPHQRPRTTLADRLRAAHNLPSLRTATTTTAAPSHPQSHQQQQPACSALLQQKEMRHRAQQSEGAALRALMQQEMSKRRGILSAAAGGVAGDFPLTSVLGRQHLAGYQLPLAQHAQQQPSAGPSSHHRSSVDIVNAAIDALRNSS